MDWPCCSTSPLVQCFSGYECSKMRANARIYYILEATVTSSLVQLLLSALISRNTTKFENRISNSYHTVSLSLVLNDITVSAAWYGVWILNFVVQGLRVYTWIRASVCACEFKSNAKLNGFILSQVIGFLSF